ncbi:MAG: RDD family protein [Actinomycetota bacterium]|nr:RDD family protein [Actinomycetota bacterium]MDQ3681255.1 RDD family protein [Actinomycetota bacterium]
MAEWWKRLVAVIVDGLILGVPLMILYIILVAGRISQTTIDPVTGEIETSAGLFGGAFLLFFLVAAAANLAYYGLMNGGPDGQTVGKKVMKIQVRDADSGGPIGVGRGVGRAAIPSVAGALCGLIALVDGLWPLWDDKRQALHDKVANSVVVDA